MPQKNKYPVANLSVLPVFRPSMGQEEIDAIAEVIKSGWIGLGPKTEEFEKKFAAFVNSGNAIALSSATAALHLSLLALGIGKGDEVLVPSLTFVSTSHAVLYVGAKPVFVDIDEETLCMDPGDLERKITRKAKAIIPGLVEMAKNPELSRDALSVLRDVGLLETEEQANTLAELLESESEEIAVDAWLALTEAGKKVAVPAFIQKLNSPKKLAQLLAAGGLGETGKGDSRVVPALKSALEKEKDERVIQEINSALEKLAGKTAE